MSTLLEPPVSLPITFAVARPDAEMPAAPEPETLEELVVRAEESVARHEYRDALAALADAPASEAAYPDLTLRALFAGAWARMYLGELEEAIETLERARDLAERACFTDVHRAEALFRLGCCRLKLSQVGVSASLLTLALALCDGSGLPCDRLRARILEWRSRCHQRQRDWEAARADVERALELAEGAGDSHLAAHAYFQASLVAEREGQFMLARFYAEEAKAIYDGLDDRQNIARLLNNLGGLDFLLGDAASAVRRLEEAVRVARATGNAADAAQATSSLAQVQLRTGHPELAELNAREALAALEGRLDYLEEIGNAQLVLGRSLLEQGRREEAAGAFADAERSFERFSSVSHRAAAWVAQGDLAAAGGDVDRAAALYRSAAEALQDFHF